MAWKASTDAAIAAASSSFSSSPKMKSVKILPNDVSPFDFLPQECNIWPSFARVKSPPPRVSKIFKKKLSKICSNFPLKKACLSLMGSLRAHRAREV